MASNVLPDRARARDAHAGAAALLAALDADPTREGLRDTPRRMVAALLELTENRYNADTVAAQHLSKTFVLDAGEVYDQIILSSHIPFVSLCEHHVLPFEGVAHVAYIPDPERRQVVGLSKLARTVQTYAATLQIQERLTQQVANAINRALRPAAVGVIVTASHSCQRIRGAGVDGRMTTSSLHGAFRSDPAARAELQQLIRDARV